LIRVTDANYAAARLFGAKNPQEFLNDPSVLMTPELEGPGSDLLRAIAEGQRIVETELVLTTMQKERVSTIVTIVLPEPGSGYESVLCTFVDLTEAQSRPRRVAAGASHARPCDPRQHARRAHGVDRPRGEPTLAAILNNAMLAWVCCRRALLRSSRRFGRPSPTSRMTPSAPVPSSSACGRSQGDRRLDANASSSPT
jgi:hypothetical protein